MASFCFEYVRIHILYVGTIWFRLLTIFQEILGINQERDYVCIRRHVRKLGM